jgi:3-isopropylmalate dehydrogenase
VRVKIVLLPGDGIGPEVIAQAKRVLTLIADSRDHEFSIEEYPIGAVAIREHGVALPAETLQACTRANAVLLGAVGDPSCDHLPREQRPEAGLLALRAALGSFANLRPARTEPALVNATPYKPECVAGADVLIVRELLGGLYYGSPRGVTRESAHNTMRYSRDEIARVVRVAFEQARTRRLFLTSVDKANVLETSQLWRSTVNEIAPEYPDVRVEHMYVDACAMRLAIEPKRFDVIVTENLFGDILSDQAAALAGSIGMLPSASIGGRVGLFEPVHGSAPDIAGRGIANPIGQVWSGAMMLDHFGERAAAQAIERAIAEVLAEGGTRTPDLGGNAGTKDLGAAIAAAIR